MLDKNKISAHVQALQSKLNLTNDQFGESIGVSGSYISLIKNGKREMSKDLFDKFCLTYNFDPKSFLTNAEEKSFEVADTLNDLMRIRKISLEEISDLTGIPLLDLSQIARGKLAPTPEHMKVIAKAFGMKPEYIENGSIRQGLAFVQKGLELLPLPQETIDYFLKALEREL